MALDDTVAFTAAYEVSGWWRAARNLPFREFLALGKEAFRTMPLSEIAFWFDQQWLLALDRRDGSERWRAPLGVGLYVPRNSSGAPVVVGSQVIISSPISKTVFAFDAGTGRERWHHHFEVMRKGSATVIGDDLLFGDRKGTLTILKLTDGTPIGRCSAGGPFTVFAPQLVGRTLFTATKDGWVHAVPYDSLRRRALQVGNKSCF